MAGYGTESRSMQLLQQSGSLKDRFGSQITVPIDILRNSVQKQTTYSYRNKYESIDLAGTPSEIKHALLEEPELVGRKPFDTGHNFRTTKRYWQLGNPEVYLQGHNGTWYRGPMVPTFGTFNPNVDHIPAINTAFYGPLAIKNTVPTSPAASLTNGLIELVRDGIPNSLLGSLGTNHLKKVYRDPMRTNDLPLLITLLQGFSGDYLNFVFGIVPLLKDVQGMLRSVSNSKRIIDQYLRDSGRWTRRRYRFGDMKSVESLYSATNVLKPFNNGISGAESWYPLFEGYVPASPSFPPPGLKGSLEVTQTSYQKYSFSGAYSYFLEEGTNAIDQVTYYADLADKLLGVELTPDVLWNAAPWSWLVDWYWNVGVNISNATAFSNDGLVIRYGYLMRHTVIKTTATAIGLRSYNGRPYVPSATFVEEQKERVKATPFGFGSNSNTWSARQWAILASLGMTRSPRVTM